MSASLHIGDFQGMTRGIGSCIFQENRYLAPSFGTGASHNKSGAPGFQANEKSVGVSTDFFIPALEQLLALGRFAIGLEVIIDELDVLEARGFLWNLG